MKQTVITHEKFLRLFEENTNELEGSNPLQTPNSTVISWILQIHGKIESVKKLLQNYSPITPNRGIARVSRKSERSKFAKGHG
jgi:hypothetical protein